MTASFIDFNKLTDHVEVTAGGRVHRIRVVGTYDNPYFCGKDVCTVLNYKNIKVTLRTQVDSYDKKMLSEFIKEAQSSDCTTSLGQNNLINLSYNDSRAIYINEAGLYDLILSSKMPFAEEFKKMVIHVILPSIRRHGKYILEQQLIDSMTQLSLEDKVLEDKVLEE